MHGAVEPHRKGVDGEVAAVGVIGEVAAKADHRMAPVGFDVLAQGRDLEGHALHEHGHRAMRDARRDAPQARLLGPIDDALRRGRGRDVIFVHRTSEQRVADRAADDPGFLAVAIQQLERFAQRGHRKQGRGRRRHWIAPGTSRPFSICAGA